MKETIEHNLEWWDLLQDAQDRIESEQAVERFQVERVMIWWKVFPFLLSGDDFSKMVKENDYLRHPDDYKDVESQTMLDRVANDNIQQKEAA